MPPLLPPLPDVLRPDPGQARSWVERELSRAEYHRPLLERFVSWVRGLWESLTRSALAASPLSTGVAVVLLVAVLALVVVAAARLRRDPSLPAAAPSLLSGTGPSPDEHRAAAEAALVAGRPQAALVEAFRALASRSLGRGLVEARPGLTAHELADDLSPAFRAHADDLARAARLFDLVFYGEQPVDAGDARSVLALDVTLRDARPDLHAANGDRPGAAVPR
jgi:Domain of unknown function (DUF4129)